MDKKERGAILKSLREEKKLRQSDLADFLEISQQAYQRYENGTSEPNGDGFVKLADFYNVSTDYLLGRTSVKAMAVTAEDEMSEQDIKAIENSIVDSYTQMSVETRRACIKAIMQIVGDVFDIEEIPDDEELLQDTKQAL